MAAKTKPLPLLSRRLRRWQDARGLTNQAAADFFGASPRSYRDALYGSHLPRGAGKVHFERLLRLEEGKLQLPPIENIEA